jgi:hypothetical protein
VSDIKSYKPLTEWCKLEKRNYNTMIKRRAAAGVGTCIPPGTWLLTKAEWEICKKTPIPGAKTIKAEK